MDLRNGSHGSYSAACSRCLMGLVIATVHVNVARASCYQTPGKDLVWQDEGTNVGSVSFNPEASPDDGTPGACAGHCDSTPGCNGFAKCHGPPTCWMKSKTITDPASEPTQSSGGCTSFYACLPTTTSVTSSLTTTASTVTATSTATTMTVTSSLTTTASTVTATSTATTMTVTSSLTASTVTATSTATTMTVTSSLTTTASTVTATSTATTMTATVTTTSSTVTSTSATTTVPPSELSGCLATIANTTSFLVEDMRVAYRETIARLAGDAVEARMVQVFIVYGNVCADVRRLQDVNGTEEALEEVTEVALTYVITFPGHQGEAANITAGILESKNASEVSRVLEEEMQRVSGLADAKVMVSSDLVPGVGAVPVTTSEVGQVDDARVDGRVVAGIVGGVLCCCCCCGILYAALRRRKRHQDDQAKAEEATQDEAGDVASQNEVVSVSLDAPLEEGATGV